MSRTLILLRHGESIWSAQNRFTGWVDVPLSRRGFQQSRRAGQLLREAGVLPDIVFTSLLRRTTETADVALDEAGRLWIPVERSWRLNERHYGALQGKNKEDIRREFGEERFFTWRRSYSVRPPVIESGSPFDPSHDARYAGEHVPRSEALVDVYDREIPYWHTSIEPRLRAGRRVLIVGHGNSLRALLKYIDRIPDRDIRSVNVPTGVPLVFTLDDATLRPRSVTFLGDEVPDSGLE